MALRKTPKRIYRIATACYGTGPWSTQGVGALVIDWDRSNDDHTTWLVVGKNGRLPSSSFTTNDSDKHDGVGELPRFKKVLRNDRDNWYVACVSLKDLTHWFNTEGALQALHETGYVIEVWDTYELINDRGTKQCMFNKKSSTLVEKRSILDLLPLLENNSSKRAA